MSQGRGPHSAGADEAGRPMLRGLLLVMAQSHPRAVTVPGGVSVVQAMLLTEAPHSASVREYTGHFYNCLYCQVLCRCWCYKNKSKLSSVFLEFIFQL